MSSTFNQIEIQKKISEGQLNDALEEILPFLQSEPEHPDACYLAAVCYRYKKDFAIAQSYINKLKDFGADKGRVYQEQGHLYKANQQFAYAIAAYQTACQINPALVASWRALAELFSAAGKQFQAQHAITQIESLKNQPKILVSVLDLISQGKLFKAESLCKQFLQQQPQHTEAMRLLAQIASKLGATEEAEFLLESASEFQPDNSRIIADYIHILRRRQQFEKSQQVAKQLYQTDSNNPEFISILAIAKLQLADYEGAIKLFDRVLENMPSDPVTLTSKGHALKTWGKQQAAIDSYQAAIKNNPSYGEAYYSLSNLKTYQFEDQQIDQMLMIENSGQLSANNGAHIYFALGKAFEDRSNWQKSFDYYRKGNQLKKQQSSYSAQKMTEELLEQRSFFTEENIAQLAKSGYQDNAAIFIVGLPRAGSTLLEQILSSHSLVDGTLELPNMLSIAQKLRRKGKTSSYSEYPQLLLELKPEELSSLGQQYIEETRVHRKKAPFFIDKMPNNFRHIGLIKAILPNAKIIDARRHPVACCFSGFKQLFAEGQEFSYSIEDITRYYKDYMALMKHWDTIYPGAVLRVIYEDVTEDLEGQVKRILDFCELPFENACLEFYKSDRAVRTASSEQVRQPIYQSGVDQWKNFATQLTPLVEKLGNTVTQYKN